MKLPSARKRAQLYDQLSVYIDAGTPIVETLDSLSRSGNPAIRHLCEKARVEILGGRTFADALITAEPSLPRFEYTVLRSSELAGRLPIGCKIVTDALNRLLELRRSVLTASIYPLLMLHAAILLTQLVVWNVKTIATGYFDIFGYCKSVGILLLSLHGILWGLMFLIRFVAKNLGAASKLEIVLRSLPVVGKTWKSLVVSRFAQAYDGMLNAGTNVVDALEVASCATNSALLRSKIQAILPHIQQGQPVGAWLQANQVLGNPWEEFWVTGENSGKQEEMLKRIIKQSTAEAEHGFAILRAWVPKIIFILAAIWLVKQLAMAYMAYIQGIFQAIDKAMMPND